MTQEFSPWFGFNVLRTSVIEVETLWMLLLLAFRVISCCTHKPYYLHRSYHFHSLFLGGLLLDYGSLKVAVDWFIYIWSCQLGWIGWESIRLASHQEYKTKSHACKTRDMVWVRVVSQLTTICMEISNVLKWE